MNKLEQLKQSYPEASRHLFWVTVAAGLMLAVGLTWFIHDGINYQEKYNIHLSLLKHLGIYAQGSSDDPMPVYFVFLHWFNSLVGGSYLIWDRLVSLVAYVLLVYVAYFIGRMSARRSFAGLIAALVLASSPFMLWYGSRATVYSVLALLVGLNLLCFIGLMQAKRWSLFLYLPVSALGLSLHFFFLAILIPQLFYLIIKHKVFKPLYFKVALFSLLVVLLGFGAWLWLSLGSGVSYWHLLPQTAKPSTTNTFIIFFQYIFGFQSVVVTTLIISLWPLLVILALLAVQKYVRPPEGVKYLFYSATVPIILLFFTSWLWLPLFLSSYLIVCLPPFLIFLAWYLSAYNLKVLSLARYALLAGMLAMMALEIVNWHLALHQDYLGLISGL